MIFIDSDVLLHLQHSIGELLMANAMYGKNGGKGGKMGKGGGKVSVKTPAAQGFTKKRSE